MLRPREKVRTTKRGEKKFQGKKQQPFSHLKSVSFEAKKGQKRPLHMPYQLLKAEIVYLWNNHFRSIGLDKHTFEFRGQNRRDPNNREGIAWPLYQQWRKSDLSNLDGIHMNPPRKIHDQYM